MSGKHHYLSNRTNWGISESDVPYRMCVPSRTTSTDSEREEILKRHANNPGAMASSRNVTSACFILVAWYTVLLPWLATPAVRRILHRSERSRFEKQPNPAASDPLSHGSRIEAATGLLKTQLSIGKCGVAPKSSSVVCPIQLHQVATETKRHGGHRTPEISDTPEPASPPTLDSSSEFELFNSETDADTEDEMEPTLWATEKKAIVVTLRVYCTLRLLFLEAFTKSK
jgi:hypothetical protein